MTSKLPPITHVSRPKPKITNEPLYRRDSEGNFVLIAEDVCTVEEEVVDINWDKIWLGHVLEALSCIGSKQLDVARYLISRKDKHTNMIHMTQEQIAEGSGVSIRTVVRVMQSLEESNFISRRPGYCTINPDYIWHGSAEGRMAVLRIYNEKRE